MKLFQSIFGGGERRGAYPESLVAAAIERAVDSTDSRLRLLPGYRKRLHDPVIRAIDQVVALVDSLPPPVPVGPGPEASEPRLTALFASPAEMLDALARDKALHLASPGRVFALLIAQRVEKRILGMDLAGDLVRREVEQVTVSFLGHRLLEPQREEEEMRRLLKRRAYDHLLALALAQITERRVARTDLTRQRDLLRRKLAVLAQAGLALEPMEGSTTDAAGLSAELDEVTEKLDALGADQETLGEHLELVAGLLEEAQRQLWWEDRVLHLDTMNIRREPTDPEARRIELRELSNAEGRHAVVLPIVVDPQSLPEREAFLDAAMRYY